MIGTLEQAVITELEATGPVPAELRLLARDRAQRAERAVADVVHQRLLGSFLRTVAARIASMVREEHAAGIRVRG